MPRNGRGSGTRKPRPRPRPHAPAPRDGNAIGGIGGDRDEGRALTMTRLAIVTLVVMLSAAWDPAVRAAPAPGTTIDQASADQVRDLLPPEIYKHYQNGDYTNAVVDFPPGRFRWDDGFDEATRQNGERLTLDENKQPVDRATMKRPDYLTGIPFPGISGGDPEAGAKGGGELAYAYYTGGNSHNWTILNWLSRTGVQRQAVQDVYFLYYDGQPRDYSPKSNPQNRLFQFLAVTARPADLQGTAALGYRFKDPGKRDLSWAYV